MSLKFQISNFNNPKKKMRRKEIEMSFNGSTSSCSVGWYRINSLVMVFLSIAKIICENLEIVTVAEFVTILFSSLS